MAYRYKTIVTQKKWPIFSDGFRVKEPRHSETIFAKKRYTSIVARVGSGAAGNLFLAPLVFCAAVLVFVLLLGAFLEGKCPSHAWFLPVVCLHVDEHRVH